MDYNRIYREFIADRKFRESGLTGYVESHHILPRSKGGTNDPSNLIDLTPSDHFFAHLLLAKMYGGTMWFAVNIMAYGPAVEVRLTDPRLTLMRRKWYALAKVKVSLARTGVKLPSHVREKMRASHKGKKLSPEHVANLAAANTGKKRTKQFVEAMRARLKGRKLSPELAAKLAVNAKNSPRMSGMTHSAATKARMSAVNQAKKEFVARNGGDVRKVSIPMMRADGIDI